MTIDDYGFYFEEAGRSASQGAIAPAEEHFEGSTAEAAVVRETGQNSIDAVRGDGPVRMEFEIATMATGDIPGIGALRKHLAQVAKATEGQAGHDRMKRAAELANEETITVLRISDYGTTGLTGTERIHDSKSPLSALTRGSGNSSDDGTRGGSFGIGSAVGPMASELSTVLYTSLPEDADETVFAGYSRLASHTDDDDIVRGGDGFFTRLEADDFDYLRPAPVLSPFPARTEPGTDIYILGFRMAANDPHLEGIRDAAIDNFMVAIDRGKLEVRGLAPGGSWELTAGTIQGYAEHRPESRAFYRALQDPTPDVRQSPRLGEVKLYVNIDETLKKSLHTITMRRPLMRIGTFRHRSVSAKYAAVLVCADEKGNKLLRKLEPPPHDRWDPGRSPEDGGPAVSELKRFVRESLRARVRDELGDVVEIKGLERFLPANGLSLGDEGPGGAPGEEPETSDAEASKVKGDPTAADVRVTTRRTVSVGVKGPAVSGSGDQPIDKGADRGGDKKRKGGGTGLGGEGDAGDGESRITAGDVRFRSWASSGATSDETLLVVSLTARSDIAGDLQLVPLGPGGAMEDTYVLPIRSVERLTGNGPESIEFEGNVLQDLDLAADDTTRLQIAMPAGFRFRLGVA